MRPRNKRERDVVRLQGSLPSLSAAQMGWVETSVVKKRIYTTCRRHWCTDCGHVWRGASLDGEKAVCPHCGTEAEVFRGRHTRYKDFAYAQFFHVHGGWQVIRYTLVRWDCRMGQKPEIVLEDVIQKWCQPGKPMVTTGVSLGMISYYRTIPYSFDGGPLTIKQNHSYFYSEWMIVQTYPRVSLLSVYLKHLGRHPDWADHELYAPTLLGDVFGCPYLERLWKEKDWKRLKAMLGFSDQLNKYWPSVKVALRHGYEPDDWSSYFDLLKMLKYLRKDMTSPHYVAPEDFGEMHRKVLAQYNNRIERMERRRRECEALRRAEEDEKENQLYAAKLKRYEGLEIVGGGIVIRPLMTVAEFREEGAKMGHCVFSLGYYKKPYSLILSARHENGERIETVEVDIRDFRINQCHGRFNSDSAYHDTILALVNGSMKRIREMTANKKDKRLPTHRPQVVGM